MTLRKGAESQKASKGIAAWVMQVCLVTGLVDTGERSTNVGPSPARTVCRCSKQLSAEKLLLGKQCKKFSKPKKTLETTGSSRLQRELQIHPGLPGVKNHENAKTPNILTDKFIRIMWKKSQST